MTRYIAFLRAINVGGHTVKMADLRTLFEALGFSEVETFIASGNVIFSEKSKNVAALQRRIEAHLRESFGFEVATFIRTDAEVTAAARHQAFSDSALKSAVALNVAFLAEPLEEGATQALRSLSTGTDHFHIHGREIYWLSRMRQSESVISNAVIEKKIHAKSTLRGMNTLLKLSAKYAPEASPHGR